VDLSQLQVYIPQAGNKGIGASADYVRADIRSYEVVSEPRLAGASNVGPAKAPGCKWPRCSHLTACAAIKPII
jgi:hypothetical protein